MGSICQMWSSTCCTRELNPRPEGDAHPLPTCFRRLRYTLLLRLDGRPRQSGGIHVRLHPPRGFSKSAHRALPAVRLERDANTPLDQNPKCSSTCDVRTRPGQRHRKPTGSWAPMSLNGAPHHGKPGAGQHLCDDTEHRRRLSDDPARRDRAFASPYPGCVAFSCSMPPTMSIPSWTEAGRYDAQRCRADPILVLARGMRTGVSLLQCPRGSDRGPPILHEVPSKGG